MRFPHRCRTAAALLFLCAMTACTTQRRHALLTFFFEGVPPLEGETEQTSTAPATIAPPTNSPAMPLPPPPAAPVVKRVFHKPFQDRQCASCHASNMSQSLKGTQKEVCLSCHTKVLTGVDVQHWPVRKGKCTACHEPHTSVNAKLVKKTGAALCADCHEPPKKAFLHEPVRRGRCQSCHTVHESPFRGLLTKDGDAVCLRCHEAPAMQALAAHADAGDQACVKCHDPHQSDKRGLLK